MWTRSQLKNDPWLFVIFSHTLRCTHHPLWGLLPYEPQELKDRIRNREANKNLYRKASVSLMKYVGIQHLIKKTMNTWVPHTAMFQKWNLYLKFYFCLAIPSYLSILLLRNDHCTIFDVDQTYLSQSHIQWCLISVFSFDAFYVKRCPSLWFSPWSLPFAFLSLLHLTLSSDGFLNVEWDPGVVWPVQFLRDRERSFSFLCKRSASCRKICHRHSSWKQTLSCICVNIFTCSSNTSSPSKQTIGNQSLKIMILSILDNWKGE